MSSVGLAIHRLEPQSARGRARLKKILEAATDLFLEVGYEQTSIDAILLQSGGSKSTLYAYFPTKQDLFRAVIDNVVANSDLGGALDLNVIAPCSGSSSRNASAFRTSRRSIGNAGRSGPGAS
jgi:AcrR family transcriptional regulator